MRKATSLVRFPTPNYLCYFPNRAVHAPGSEVVAAMTDFWFMPNTGPGNTIAG